MECNRDEATRAKEIAERKFSAKDIPGARKFALKAQALFPDLEGIPQMLSTLDVYISADNKINGEADWYGILGVDPKAEDETVRKQYRKLALMLHPDKNKSIGSDGAFKLISEAWTLLSDKAKRTAYDQKRNVKSPENVKVSTNQEGGSSVSTPGANGYSSTKVHKSSSKPPKSNSARAGHSSTPTSATTPTHHKPKPNTFWTVCHGCKMQYEYLRVYLNHNLLCPNCHDPFLARETAPPSSNGTKSQAPWNYSQKRQSSSKQTTNKKAFNTGGGFTGSDSHNQTNFQWVPFSKTSGASSAAQAASMVQQAYEKVKREREEAEAAARREEALRQKNHSSKRASGASSTDQPNAAKRRKGIDDTSEDDAGWDFVYEIGVKIRGMNSSGSKPTSTETGGPNKGSSTSDFSRINIQGLLMEKAREEIRKKLVKRESVGIMKPVVNVDENQNVKANEEEKSSRNSDLGHDQSKAREPIDTNVEEGTVKSAGLSRTHLEMEAVKAMSIDVPDPDFHDFDKDRTEKSFENNQIWAAYDGDDGMPRYYAMVHSLISTNPFKIRIGWLNSKTNGELGPLNWVSSGFTKTCGDFRVGRYEINTSLNSFSHKVRWLKGLRGAILIYPRKGEIWALYKNWSPDWNELTEEEVIHKYDIVEVLEDYSEELGITIIPLVKVAGFKTVFHRHLDPKQVKTIHRDEMFRFSHRVPSCVLTGQEAPNAPKGCRELDPAATPLELLRVIPDAKELEIPEIEDEVGEKDTIVGNAEQPNGKDEEIEEKSSEVAKDDTDELTNCKQDAEVKE